MKTTRITLIVVSLLLASFTWGAGTSATGGFCPAAVFQNLVNRVPNLQVAIEQKLSAYVRNNLPSIHANTKRPSWVSISDPQERTQQAMADARKAIAKANDTSGDALDQAAAEALTDTLSRERCVLAKTELDVAGSGFGKHSNLRGNTKAKDALEKMEGPINKIKSDGFDYTELEALRDVDDLTSLNVPGKEGLLSKLEKNNDPTDAGPLSELHSVSRIGKSPYNENVIGLESAYTGATGKPVDFRTDKNVYQNAARNNSIKSKIRLKNDQNPAEWEKTRQLAENIRIVDLAEAPKKFKFSGSQLDPSLLQPEIDALNEAFREIGYNRVFSVNDFLNIAWD